MPPSSRPFSQTTNDIVSLRQPPGASFSSGEMAGLGKLGMFAPGGTVNYDPWISAGIHDPIAAQLQRRAALLNAGAVLQPWGHDYESIGMDTPEVVRPGDEQDLMRLLSQEPQDARDLGSTMLPSPPPVAGPMDASVMGGNSGGRVGTLPMPMHKPAPPGARLARGVMTGKRVAGPPSKGAPASRKGLSEADLLNMAELARHRRV